MAVCRQRCNLRQCKFSLRDEQLVRSLMEVIDIMLLRYDAKKKVLTGVSLAEYKQVEVIVDCPGLEH